MAAVAVFAALWLALILETGPLTMPLILLAGVLGWSYSSPPLKLNMHGLGEITGAALVTGLTPIVGYYMQAGVLNLLPFLAVFPLACFQFAMLMVVNFPDAAGDIVSDKHTLLYFAGSRTAVRIYLSVLTLAYLSLPLLVWLGLPIQVALALLLISPMAIWQGRRMWRGAWADPVKWDSLGFWSIGLVMSSSGVEFLAFLLLVMR
jgi:1,4-dihydroxy-2-naphthoate octaprenyltransferase